jgi:hypothetical protein
VARPAEKPLSIKVIADHVEESAEVSDLVDRLEAEADRDIVQAEAVLARGHANG